MTTPTPGAIRAAEALWRDEYDDRVILDGYTERAAAIIDHETHAGELLAAVKLQLANIERWLETGVPATAEESKAIYEQLKAAAEAAEG